MKIFKVWWWINNIKYLLRHRHKWHTTHVNGYQIPTRQICLKCGVSREASTEQAGKPLSYCWLYSDGGISEELGLGDLGKD